MSRQPGSVYTDPLDLIWLAAARELGIRVERTDDVYASWDGNGTLSIARNEHFDPDDSLAQMIFHELCHALVAGSDGYARRDWGLDDTDGRDVVQEHATNRLQAALGQRWGLRRFMATTTEFREYYEAWSLDPFGPPGDAAAELARRAAARARESRWAEVLETALRRTAEVAAIVRPVASDESLWACTEPLHRTGFVLARDAAHTCGRCAWSYATRGRRLACRQAKSPERTEVVSEDERGCVRWEPKITARDCAGCAACCREGFHVVPVRPREALRRAHPELIRGARGNLFVPRPGGCCLALEGNGAQGAPYRCRVYAVRPRACAEFPIGGDSCLEARRRVGLSH